MTDETRTRFLAAIAAQIPPERVKEVHLFGAIRQGGAESGVAVIAVEREAPVTVDVDGGYVPPAAVADAVPVETPAVLAVHDQLDDEASFVADEVADDVASEVADDLAPLPAELADARPAEPPPRYTVYTARYRHTLKGLDRGKWEVSVTEEADAPLLTVDAVVRGVSRRSGEEDDTERLSGDEFRAALPEPARA
jgi:hypothetical protein